MAELVVNLYATATARIFCLEGKVSDRILATFPWKKGMALVLLKCITDRTILHSTW